MASETGIPVAHRVVLGKGVSDGLATVDRGPKRRSGQVYIFSGYFGADRLDDHNRSTWDASCSRPDLAGCRALPSPKGNTDPVFVVIGLSEDVDGLPLRRDRRYRGRASRRSD